MKRLFVLAAAALMLCTVPIFPASASGEDEAFLKEYFPAGSISAPTEAPYVHYTDQYSDGTYFNGVTEFYYDIPEELSKLGDACLEMGTDAFAETYKVNFGFQRHIQIDVKVDDDIWISECGNWDILDYGGIDPQNYACSFTGDADVTDLAKVQSFGQGNLYYERPEFLNEALLFRTNSNGETVTDFNLTEHTISYRYRYYLSYTLITEEEVKYPTTEGYVIFGGWSPVTSIGKDGTQQPLEKPAQTDAPVLSEFTLHAGENEFNDAEYRIDIPQSVYDANKYFLVMEDGFEPFMLETQMKVGDGEWTDCYTANATWLTSGYRSVSYEGSDALQEGSEVALRVRLVCDDAALTTDWSNIIGTSPEFVREAEAAAETTEVIEEADISPAPQDSEICTLCGKCARPLGFCILLWITAICAVLIIICILLLTVARKPAADRHR